MVPIIEILNCVQNSFLVFATILGSLLSCSANPVLLQTGGDGVHVPFNEYGVPSITVGQLPQRLSIIPIGQQAEIQRKSFRLLPF